MYSTSTKMAGRLSSPTSTMSLVHHHQLHDEPFDDMPVFTSPSKGGISNSSTHGGDNNSVTAVSVTASVTSSSTFLEEDNSERSLRAQIESLRQQLAERDATVNELQRQMQADKRQYDKLQQRWDLFFGGTTSGGGSNSTTPSTTSSRTSYRASSHLTSNHQETTTMTATELQRLNDHMDQLETEKEAAQQKTLKLSLALADCKARVNTLEMELEESHGIIQAQNTSTGILLGFGRRQSSSLPTPVSSKKDRKSGRRSVSNSPATPVKSPAITAVTPPPFMGISDIELDEESEHQLPPQDQSTDEFLHNDATPAIQEEDALHSASFDTNEESFLGNWSQRPLSFLSERPTDASQPLTSSSQRPIPSGSMRGSSSHGGRSSWGRFWSSSSNVTQPQQ